MKHRFLVLSRALALWLVRSCSLSCPLISLFLLSDSFSLASSRFLPLSIKVSFTLAFALLLLSTLLSLFLCSCSRNFFALNLNYFALAFALALGPALAPTLAPALVILLFSLFSYLCSRSPPSKNRMPTIEATKQSTAVPISLCSVEHHFSLLK